MQTKLNHAKVIWYEGCIDEAKPSKVLNEITVEYNGHVINCDWIGVLSTTVQKQYELECKYARYIELIPEKKYTIDYGSYSLYVMIEALD